MYQISDFQPPVWGSRPCPFCKRELSRNRGEVLVSGCCPLCGRTILECSTERVDVPFNSKTLEQFAEKSKSLHSRWAKRSIWTVVWFGIAALGMVLFREEIQRALAGWMSADSVDSILMAVVYLPMIVSLNLMVLQMVWFDKTAPHCSHCRVKLSMNVRCVLATGRCPNCTRFALNDFKLPEGNPTFEKWDISEFVQRRKAIIKKFTNPMNVATVWAGVGMLGLFIVMSLQLVTQTDFEKRFGILPGTIIAFTSLIGIATVIWLPEFIAILRASKQLSSGLSSVPNLCCPQCGKGLGNSNLSIATKRCEFCLQIVFAEPTEIVSNLP